MKESDFFSEPRRSGDTYCSRSCGRGCLAAEHELATIRGEMLVARLNQQQGGFTDWVVDVWHNSGWHYRAMRPIEDGESSHGTRTECHVHEHRDRQTGEIRDGKPYWCSLIINGKQFCFDAETPEEAVALSMAEAREFHERFIKQFSRFKAIV